MSKFRKYADAQRAADRRNTTNASNVFHYAVGLADGWWTIVTRSNI